MYMSEMIRERQNSEKVERHDLFSNLLAANDEDMDIVNLTESELIGASWILSKWLKLDIQLILKETFTSFWSQDMRYLNLQST